MVFLEVERFAASAQLFAAAQDQTLAAANCLRRHFLIVRPKLTAKFEQRPRAVAPPRPTLPFETADLIPGKTQWERLASNLTRSIGGAAAAKSHQDLAAIKLDAAAYELEGLIADLSSVMRVVRSVAGAPVIGRIEPAIARSRRDKALAA